VARTIFDVIEDESLLEQAAVQGERVMKRLRDEVRIREKVQEVRGRGLMIGIELKNAPDKFVLKAAQRGVILNVTAQKGVRTAPPINVASDVLEKGIDLVIEAISQDA